MSFRLLVVCLCCVMALVGLAACGSSGTPPTTPKAAPRLALATHAVRQPPRAGGCDQAVSAFAQEKRIAGAERAALEGLISALARYPVALRCASTHITVLAQRPAGAGRLGKPDYTCLAAATDVQVLQVVPGVAGPVKEAAAVAEARINMHERHGSTFCVYR